MWIQLTSTQQIEESGKPHTYRPGDWVEVGKHVALLWLSQGAAILPEAITEGFNLYGVGVLTDHKELLCQRLRSDLKTLKVEEGAPAVIFDKTILMDSTLSLRTSLIPVGATLLDTWEIAVPLMDYAILAKDLGDEIERERTKQVIHDLRVPVYDTRLIFVRRNETTERMIDAWRNAGQTPLAFLRVLYQVKPFILALPCTWTSASYPVKND